MENTVSNDVTPPHPISQSIVAPIIRVTQKLDI